MSPKFDVWVDPKQGVVIVDGQVSLRRGMLEMFACIRNTKEHESVVTVDSEAFLVHTGLIMLGAEPGSPVQFVPDFKPPTGTEIEVTAMWRNVEARSTRSAGQEWVRDLRTNKEMAHPWVFAGSRFWTDEETGKQYYQAEGGDFICVSNFSTATLDIPVPSSQSNEALEYEAFTDRIPPLGTRVRLVLTPVLKEKKGMQVAERARQKCGRVRPFCDLCLLHFAVRILLRRDVVAVQQVLIAQVELAVRRSPGASRSCRGLCGFRSAGRA